MASEFLCAECHERTATVKCGKCRKEICDAPQCGSDTDGAYGYWVSYCRTCLDGVPDQDCACRKSMAFGHYDDCPLLEAILASHRLPDGSYE
jgi:hypothetical protein